MRHASGSTPLRLLALLALTAAGRQLAGQALPERPVHWRLTQPAGGDAAHVRLRLAATMVPGWYIYSLTQAPGGPTRTTVALAPGGRLVQDGDVLAPTPTRYDDPNFGFETETYHGAVAFTIPTRTGPEPGAVAALVRYQTCNDRICLPAHTDTVRLSAPAQPGAGATSTAGGTAPAAGAGPASAGARAAQSATGPPVGASMPGGPAPVGGAAPSAAPTASAAPGSMGRTLVSTTGTVASPVAFLWLAAIMGLLSLLTPCVFPMLPITIAFFTRRDEAETVPANALTGAASAVVSAARGGTLLNAAAYAVGIVGAFCAAGVLLTLTLGAGGVLRLAADPWLNLAITALFLAFALNLLGLYELRLPAALMQRLGTSHGGHGPGAALLLGAAFAVTTFTCTAPFVGTLLVVATRGDWTWPLLGMLVFAVAFAVPFFLLALLPGWLARLPRSGEWLVTLRRALGVLEIAAAAKFLANADLVLGWGIFTREVVIAIWAAAAVALALIILGRPGAMRRPGRVPAFARAASILVAIAGAWWMLTGLRGANLGEMEAFLPPPTAGGVVSEELPWLLNDYEASLARARAGNRPLFIDFTGYTCTNCRWMEANMFPRPEVRAWLEGFVRVRLYTDGVGEPYGRQQALEQRMFGTVALPVYAILTPAGQPVASYVGMTRNSREFNEFLARGLAAVRGPDSAASARRAESARAAEAREFARRSILAGLGRTARPLPAFALPRLDGGGHFSSAELKGKVAVINFWGTWCQPCLDELPAIQKLYERYRADPHFALITLDSERGKADARQVASAFMKARGFTFPVLLADSAITEQISGWPTTWYVDRRGRIADEVYGGTWLRDIDPLDPFVWRVEALKETP